MATLRGYWKDWLSKEDSMKKNEIDEVELRGNGEFALEIVGESHFQDALEKICGPRKERGEDLVIDARLILEDENPNDDEAAYVEIHGKKVGYLTREVARIYRNLIKQAGHPRAISSVKAQIRGGWLKKNGEKGSYGVWLDIPVEVE